MSDGPVHEHMGHEHIAHVPQLTTVESSELREGRMLAHKKHLDERRENGLMRIAAAGGLVSLYPFLKGFLGQGALLTEIAGGSIVVLLNLAHKASKGIMRSSSSENRMLAEENKKLVGGH